MSGEILLFGHTKASFTSQMLEAINDYFDPEKTILYLMGPENSEHNNVLERENKAEEVIFDHKLEKNRPCSPNIRSLKKFERHHGDGVLWRSVFADRKISKNAKGRVFHQDKSPYSHQELLSHVEVRTKALEDIFERYDFDFVFGQQIGFLGGMITYVLANSHSVPFYRMGPARIKNRFVLLESIFEESPQTRAAFEQAKSEPSSFPINDAKEYIKDVRGGDSLYSIKAPSVGNSKSENRALLRRIFRRGSRLIDEQIRDLFDQDYYFESSPVKRGIEKTRKRIRKQLLEKKDVFDEYDPEREYIYFPLQTQPEQSLMIWARYHTDLPSVVKNIAQSVSMGTEVYVKEHPNMFGVRPESYYDKLRKLPNVRVISPAFSSNRVIENATSTVCLTSSVGLQSVINGTPTISLADPSYAMMDAVKQISDYSELLRIIRENVVHTSEVEAYVAACLESGINRNNTEFATEVCKLIDQAQSR